MSHIHNLGPYSADRYQQYLDRARLAASKRRERAAEPMEDTLTFDSAIDPEREGDDCGGRREQPAPDQGQDEDERHELNEQA